MAWHDDIARGVRARGRRMGALLASPRLPRTSPRTRGSLPSAVGRAPEIDAVRGWAAFSVVGFHVFWETFGVAVPWLRNHYTAALLAGHFDVVLFFILSGDALSYPFFHGGDARYLARAALKRYPRLTVPIVVVTAATALCMAGGLVTAAAAGRIVGRPDWLGTFVDFQPKAASALRFAFYHVYAGQPPRDYLPFLWTMPIELKGSFVLLPALYLCARVRGGALLLAALAAGLIGGGSYVGCFLVGALLGRARAFGVYDRLPPAFRRFGAPIGIALALGAVGFRQGFDSFGPVGHIATGTVLLFCIYSSPGLVAWLSGSRLSQFLGRISYLLYLWHFTVLVTFTSTLIVWCSGAGRVAQGPALLIGGATVAVSVALAWATLPIEAWTRRLNGALLDAVRRAPRLRWGAQSLFER